MLLKDTVALVSRKRKEAFTRYDAACVTVSNATHSISISDKATITFEQW